jgi:hypothetical protein
MPEYSSAEDVNGVAMAADCIVLGSVEAVG